jgi:hypothetical protein
MGGPIQSIFRLIRQAAGQLHPERLNVTGHHNPADGSIRFKSSNGPNNLAAVRYIRFLLLRLDGSVMRLLWSASVTSRDKNVSPFSDVVFTPKETAKRRENKSFAGHMNTFFKPRIPVGHLHFIVQNDQIKLPHLRHPIWT